MAFTFVVEDGSIVEDATSYTTTTYADDYFAVDPNADAWVALTTEQKEFYLSWATRILDQKTDWRGYLVDDAQVLRWPRKGITDRDNRAILSTVVPKQVQSAVCELAKWLIANDPTTGQDLDFLRRIKVDVIEIEYQENSAQSTYPTIVNAILYGLGTFKTGSTGFGRIRR